MIILILILVLILMFGFYFFVIKETEKFCSIAKKIGMHPYVLANIFGLIFCFSLIILVHKLFN